jgi:uncharacterized protein YodC (DUF2158 family)
MDTEIKAGDVVVLKSGGPSMTVDTVADRYGTLSAWCSWFDGKKQASHVFPLTSLRTASDDAGPVVGRVIR